MTRAYLKRYLKLQFHRLPATTLKYLSHHIVAIGIVIVLIGASLGLVWIPDLHTPAKSQASSSQEVLSAVVNLDLPPTSAKHVFIQNVDTGEVIVNRAADEELYPASTTKIVTGLVAMRYYSPQKVITVTRSYPEGQDVGFEPGEQITVENLLYALLIDSANDAAEILAENYPGGRVGFVEDMNHLAKDELKLRHTNFLNPTGLDEDGHYSSAADLGRLASTAMKNQLFSRIVSTETTIVSSTDAAQTHVLSNTNELLGKVPGVLGIKTGFTDKAGESVITLVKRENTTLVFVVMGSSDRFGDTKRLIDWAFAEK